MFYLIVLEGWGNLGSESFFAAQGPIACMKSIPGYPWALLKLTVNPELGPFLLEETGVVQCCPPPPPGSLEKGCSAPSSDPLSFDSEEGGAAIPTGWRNGGA